MTSFEKALLQILRGTSDTNVRFDDLRRVLAGLGFEERTRGGHRIFRRDDIDEILTLQPRGSKAKPYQVKQVRQLILKHKLGSHGEE